MNRLRTTTTQHFSAFRPHPCKRTIAAVVLSGVALFASSLQAQTLQGCPPPERSQGWPLDYRTHRSSLPVVERRHFTPKVEMLISGESTSRPGPDIAYTLNKFPNHHRALNALSRLGKRLSVGHVPDMDHSVDCYFERGLGFAPDDTVARLLYAQHLGSTGRADMARQQLAVTANYAGDNPLTHFNMGLVAFELKDFDFALAQAHRAQALGMTRTELRDMLQKEGRWTEPVADPAEPRTTVESDPPASDPPASNPPPASQ